MLKRLLALLLLMALLGSCAQQVPSEEGSGVPSTKDTETSDPADDSSESTPKEEETVQELTITDDYLIVAEESSLASAKKIQKEIKDLTGMTLAIVTDGNTERKEIIINDSRRKEVLSLKKELASPFLGAVTRENERLILACGSEQAFEPMVDAFVLELSSLVKRKKMTVAKDYYFEQNFAEEIAKSVINSINCEAETVTRVPTETVRVFTPDGSEDAWYFNHVPSMTYFKDRFYIFYSSGPVNESDCGQRVMMATSEDFADWDVQVLLDSVPGTAADMLLTARGCYVVDGKLTVFFYKYEYNADALRYENGKPVRPIDTAHKGKGYGMFYIQSEDGENWSAPIHIGEPYGGNNSPEVLQSGALLWAGNGRTAYSESASDIENWSNCLLQIDPGAQPITRNTESDFVQMPDGTILIFSRTGDDVMIGGASFDDGQTWTNLYRTQFTDSDARFRFGILPDGRYYFLGNMSFARNELVLLTSEDGIHYKDWYYLGEDPYTLMKPGMAKGGTYSYPEVITDGEYLYIVYSLKKESIEVKKVKLSDLTPEN